MLSTPGTQGAPRRHHHMLGPPGAARRLDGSRGLQAAAPSWAQGRRGWAQALCEASLQPDASKRTASGARGHRGACVWGGNVSFDGAWRRLRCALSPVPSGALGESEGAWFRELSLQGDSLQVAGPGPESCRGSGGPRGAHSRRPHPPASSRFPLRRVSGTSFPSFWAFPAGPLLVAPRIGPAALPRETPADTPLGCSRIKSLVFPTLGAAPGPPHRSRGFGDPRASGTLTLTGTCRAGARAAPPGAGWLLRGAGGRQPVRPSHPDRTRRACGSCRDQASAGLGLLAEPCSRSAVPFLQEEQPPAPGSAGP